LEWVKDRGSNDDGDKGDEGLVYQHDENLLIRQGSEARSLYGEIRDRRFL
jgi:hypothetical protein